MKGINEDMYSGSVAPTLSSFPLSAEKSAKTPARAKTDSQREVVVNTLIPAAETLIDVFQAEREKNFDLRSFISTEKASGKFTKDTLWEEYQGRKRYEDKLTILEKLSVDALRKKEGK